MASSSHAEVRQGRDTAKQLIQRVCRAFYDTKQVIVMDQLIRKEAMRDDELAGRVGMPTRELTKLTHRLLEDQLISVHRRQELKEGAPKAQTRTYYYMDYSHATDVIKWRMFKIERKVDFQGRNELDSQGYVCPLCRKAFSPLDYAMLADPVRNFFACDVCGTEVIDNENEIEVKKNKDRMRRFVEQTKKIRDLLKRMDEVVLPRFDVARWLEINGPSNTTVMTDFAEAQGSIGIKAEIAGDDDEAIMKARREADAEEKRTQNKLPTWISDSTVARVNSSEANSTNNSKNPAALSGMNNEEKSSRNETSRDADAGDLYGTVAENAPVDLDWYYANLAAEEEDEEEEGQNTGAGADHVGEELTSHQVENGDESGRSRIFAANGGPNGSGKRSRDEIDSGWDEMGSNAEAEEVVNGGKKAKITMAEEDAQAAKGWISGTLGAGERDNEDDDDDDFEEVGEGGDGDGDPNPLIKIGDRMVPFLEVGDDLQAAMTPEEYTTYWDIYQRLG